MSNAVVGGLYSGAGIGAANYPSITTVDHERAYREALMTTLHGLQDIAAKDMALRTFLQHAYPEILEQFEAAHAAQKRMDIKHASGK
jgi:hypothetical protein